MNWNSAFFQASAGVSSVQPLDSHPSLAQLRDTLLWETSRLQEFLALEGPTLKSFAKDVLSRSHGHVPVDPRLVALFPEEMVSQFHRKNPTLDPEASAVLWAELAKFLHLRAEHPRTFIPVMDHMDELWHHCVLQTEGYAELCLERLPGKTFVHHRSLSLRQFMETASLESLVDSQIAYLAGYLKAFGPFDEVTVRCWRLPQFLMKELGWTVADINGLAIFS